MDHGAGRPAPGDARAPGSAAGRWPAAATSAGAWRKMPTCSRSLRRPPVRCSGALPPLSRANHVPSRLLLQSGMVTPVGEHGVDRRPRRTAGGRLPGRYAVAARPARAELACHRRAAAAVSQAALAEVLGLRLAKYWPVTPST